MTSKPSISVVTPTFRRPDEVEGLLANLARQTILPKELILVDGAPEDEVATENVVRSVGATLPFSLKYIRHGGGTAIQRNAGIEAAGDSSFIAFIDDDVRLDHDFLKEIINVFNKVGSGEVGGVTGYRTNQHFHPQGSQRWRWYKRLRLLKIFEPGRYDFASGYPINNNIQPPFRGIRPIDFMTTACTVWRREVFNDGLRFHAFFKDFGVLEDAHFSLKAGRQWRLLQCGDAHCEELHSPHGRVDRRRIGFKSVVNYYFVSREVSGPLSLDQKFNFWKFQMFEFVRIAASAVRRLNYDDLLDLQGRLEGVMHVIGGFKGRAPRGERVIEQAAEECV